MYESLLRAEAVEDEKSHLKRAASPTWNYKSNKC